MLGQNPMMKIKNPKLHLKTICYNLNRSAIIQLKVMSTNLYKYMMIHKIKGGKCESESVGQQWWRSEEACGGGLRKPAVAGATKGELESKGETPKQSFGLSQVEKIESRVLSWHRSKVDEKEIDSKSRRSTSYRTTK